MTEGKRAIQEAFDQAYNLAYPEGLKLKLMRKVMDMVTDAHEKPIDATREWSRLVTKRGVKVSTLDLEIFAAYAIARKRQQGKPI